MSDLDKLLYEALTPSDEPSEYLNRQIMDRRSEMKQGTGIRKIIATAATFGCILLAGGTAVFAVNHYLQSSEVASAISEGNALAKAFASDSAIPINETQQAGDHVVTLLGMVSGRDLAICVPTEEASEIHADRSYVALAIAKKDGTPMPGENKTLSPLIAGVNWQDVTLADMDAALHWFRQDGVVYELLECDNLEVFAGRGVQLGVVDQFGEEASAFTMDAATGRYEKTAGYAGTNALFSLPLDPAKGDEAAAAAYLKKVKSEREREKTDEPNVDTGLPAEAAEVETALDAMTPEEAGQYISAHCRLTGRVTLPYDANGDLKWGEEYDPSGNAALADGSFGMMNVAGFAKGVPTYSHMSSDGTIAGTSYLVITINDDQTATMETFVLE